VVYDFLNHQKRKKMLKREISYEDFNGNQTSDVFYFNLSKAELIEMEAEYKQGMAQMLQDVIDSKDNKELVGKFKEIILMAYGEKSEDGKRFIKSESLREEFAQTQAYVELFMEMATNADAAVQFLSGILPRDIVQQMNELEAAKKEEEKKDETKPVETVASPPTN
jgi:hypothetical protein